MIMGHMPNSTPILAAYTIAGSIDRLVSVALFAAGGAASIIIGRDIGRGCREAIYSEGVALNRLCFATGLASLVFCFWFAVCDGQLYFPPDGPLRRSRHILRNICCSPSRSRCRCAPRISAICRRVPRRRRRPLRLFCATSHRCISSACRRPLSAASRSASASGPSISGICADEFIRIFLCVPRLSRENGSIMLRGTRSHES